MIDIQTISIVIASASVVAGVVYYALQLRNQTRIRKTDIVLRFDAVLTSKDLVEAWAKVLERETKEYDTYKLSNTSRWLPELQMASFYEDMGIMLHKGLLDPELCTCFPISEAWEKLKPLVVRIRKERPHAYEHKPWEWFEYLYNEMKKREQRGV